MSSFNGIAFRVLAVDDHWFPSIELDDEGKAIYNCRAWLEDIGTREAMADSLSFATYRRTLGTLDTTVHMEAGIGKQDLTIPEAAGALKTHRAILTKMGNVTAYAMLEQRGFLADLSFVITSNPWG